MPFQVRSNANPADAAANWTKGVQSSGAKLLKGYSNPRRDPKAAAKAATGRWLAAVTAAEPALAAGIDRYNADDAIASMQSNGVSRYTSSATTKAKNYASVAQNLIPAIQAVANGLNPDRSTPGARDARMVQNAQGLRALRGKYRKGA